MTWLLLLPLLSACGKDDTSKDSPPGPLDDTTAPTTDSSDDTGGTVTGHTGQTGHTGEPVPDEFTRIAENTTDWASVGYVIEEWEHDTLMGADGKTSPSVTWIRPAAEDQSVDGVVLYLHGSTGEDDSEGNPDCPLDVAEEARDRFIMDWDTLVHFATQRNLAVLAPVNLWCDAWMGQGPIDSDVPDHHHYGYSFIEESLDWALSSHSGVSVDGPVVAWGTSLGAIGAGLVATRRDEVTAAVVDSGPIDLDNQLQAAFVNTLEHILGDPGTYPERYQENSLVALIEDGVLTKPLFAVTNAQDVITHPTHGESLQLALAAAYAPNDLRYTWHDFDHPSPGSTHHVQTGLPLMPTTYVTPLLLSFLLDEQHLKWVEAEDCTVCTLGEPYSTGGWAEAASRGVAIRTLVADGPGTLIQARPPAGAVNGTVSGTAVIGLDELTEDVASTTIAAVVRWVVGGVIVAERDITVGDLDHANNMPASAAQIEKSTLALPGAFTDPQTQFEVYVTGTVPMLVDAAVFSFVPEG